MLASRLQIAKHDAVEKDFSMCAYEYKVVPAPSKGLKAKGIKTTQDRFAHALQQVTNELGADGWEYQRTDALPCEEREGLMGKATHFQHMLVVRRKAAAIAAQEAPKRPSRFCGTASVAAHQLGSSGL